MSDDEVVVREVENPNDSIKRLSGQKNKDAKWVTGLTPYDEAEELERLRRAQALAAENFRRNENGHWLLPQIIFGVVAVALLIVKLTLWSSYIQLEYPAVGEVALWSTVRSLTVVDYLQLAVPHVAMAIFVGYVCITFGSITEQMILFLGVGGCALSWLATMGELAVLDFACPVANTTSLSSPSGDTGTKVPDCFLSTTLLCLCAVVAQLAPMVSAMTLYVVLDKKLGKPGERAEGEQPTPGGPPVWLCLTGLPPALLASHSFYHYWENEPSHDVVELTGWVQVIITVLLLRRLYRQPPFTVRFLSQEGEGDGAEKLEVKLLRKKND